jgi:hypothetical protein
VNRQFGQSPLRLQGDAVGALHAFKRAGDRERLAAEHFQLRPQLEVVGRLFRPAQTGIGQPAEIIGPRIAAAAGDRG